MPYKYEYWLYVFCGTIWLFSKGSRNNEICNIFRFLRYDWIIQSYWQYRDNASLHVFAKVFVNVNLVVVTKFRKFFHRFVKWNMYPQLLSKGYFVNSKCSYQDANEYSGILLKIVCQELQIDHWCNIFFCIFWELRQQNQ